MRIRMLLTTLAVLVGGACADAPTSGLSAEGAAPRKLLVPLEVSIRLLDSGLHKTGPFEPYSTCTFYAVVMRDGQVVPTGEYDTVLWSSPAGNNVAEQEHAVSLGGPSTTGTISVWLDDIYGNSGAASLHYSVANFSSNTPGINVHCLV